MICFLLGAIRGDGGIRVRAVVDVTVLLIWFAVLPHGLTAETAIAGAEDRAESAQVLADRALDLLEKGEDASTPEAQLAAFEEGLEHAQQAVELDDTNADANFAVFANEGRIMLVEGVVPNPFNLIKINKQLDRTLDLDPNHTDALAAKGGLYRQLPRLLGGSLSKAEKCLIQAIAYDPNAIGARIELAETYREMGYPERGVTLLEQAAEIAEQDGKRAKLTKPASSCKS